MPDHHEHSHLMDEPFSEAIGVGYEFPDGVDLPPDGLSRRDLLKLMGASALLGGGVLGCQRKPNRKIVSQLDLPEYMRPGVPLYYASTWFEGNYPYSLLIKTVDGRPVKLDGNPLNPINGEKSNAQIQGSLLSLYDPDRLQTPMVRGAAATWFDADKAVTEALKAAGSLVVLTRSTLGLTERELLKALLAKKPGAKQLVYEPVNDAARRGAWQKVYGGDGAVLPQFDKAKIILSLHCDFLCSDGVALEAARQYARTRELDPKHADISRLYVAEGNLTVTGANADHRIALRPSLIHALTQALIAAVQGQANIGDFAAKHKLSTETLTALVADLTGHKGAALVVAGPQLPAETHAAVALLNELLEAPGKTLLWDPVHATLPVNSPREIIEALQGGVDALILLGVNPVYDFAAGDFAALIKKAKFSAGHGQSLDETLAVCTAALPSTHTLESWNDAQPRSGLKTTCQPVIAPMFGGRQEADSLLQWAKELDPNDRQLAECQDYHQYLQNAWEKVHYPAANSPDTFDVFWEGLLHDGQLLREAELGGPKLARKAAEELAAQSTAAGAGLEVVLYPHPGTYDGRFANVTWLQEMPDPVTRIVWDNVLLMNPATIERQGLERGDLVTVSCGGAGVTLPVHPVFGIADDVLAVYLGQGRVKAGYVGNERGFNAAKLIDPAKALTPYLAAGAKLSKTGKTYKTVTTQEQLYMRDVALDQRIGHIIKPETSDRPLVLRANLEEYKSNPKFIASRRHLPEKMDNIHTPPTVYATGHKWGMSIDLNKCVGCGICTIACQAENNIPTVGKKEVSRGREMHWIRIDRYFEPHIDEKTSATEYEMVSQPVPCMHCENAPCENVCPVNATTHSPEGVNEMTYNRCVGTRYCANNCPYKVRRFNFFDFTRKMLERPGQKQTENPQTLGYNPQVTVRSVGVMEKCTYCIQRINEAKYQAKWEGHALIADGTLKTACQQACPSDAIVFGDLNDPNSRVKTLRGDERMYRLLEDLKIEPRTSYLAKVYNPHANTPAARRALGKSHHAAHGTEDAHGHAGKKQEHGPADAGH